MLLFLNRPVVQLVVNSLRDKHLVGSRNLTTKIPLREITEHNAITLELFHWCNAFFFSLGTTVISSVKCTKGYPSQNICASSIVIFNALVVDYACYVLRCSLYSSQSNPAPRSCLGRLVLVRLAVRLHTLNCAPGKTL